MDKLKRLGTNHTILSCIKQALSGRIFLLAVSGIVSAFCIGGFATVYAAMEKYKTGLIEYGTHYTVLETAIKSDAVCLLLPVFAALPYTAEFLEELESGYIKSYLIRAGRGRYICGKIIAAAISGGMACMVGIGIYIDLLRLLMLPMEKQGKMQGAGMVFVLFFCLGMLFSLVGMLFSMITSSRYMAYASPFVFEYALIILHERYLKKLYIIYPKEWFAPSEENWAFGTTGTLIYLLLLCILIAVILVPAMERRINEI